MLSGFSSANQNVGGSISMSGKTKKKTNDVSSTSTLSVRSRTKKTPPTLSKREMPLTELGQAEVLSRPSSSSLVDLYNTDEFRLAWANDLRFHIARSILFLRRYREMSQADLAAAMGTSQSAVARIEAGEGNVTLDTLERLGTALKGRFFTAIDPQELTIRYPAPWWETQGAAGEWKCVRVLAQSTAGVQRVLAGFERTPAPTGTCAIFDPLAA